MATDLNKNLFVIFALGPTGMVCNKCTSKKLFLLVVLLIFILFI